MSARSTATPHFISLQDAAVRTGFSVFSLRDKIARGELPAYRISDKPRSAIRVKISDVDALFKPVFQKRFAARSRLSQRAPTTGLAAMIIKQDNNYDSVVELPAPHGPRVAS